MSINVAYSSVAIYIDYQPTGDRLITKNYSSKNDTGPSTRLCTQWVPNKYSLVIANG